MEALSERGLTIGRRLLKNRLLPFFIGLLLVCLSFYPSLRLGGKAYASIKDNMENAVFTLVQRAHRLKGETVTEFPAGGSENTANDLVVTMLLYMNMAPEDAYVYNDAFVQLAAYIGLFLLLVEWGVVPWIAGASGVLFSLTPFMAVQGMTVVGQPLLAYACIKAAQGKKIWPYLLGAFFALNSSLILAGYADCGIILLIAILETVRKRRVAWSWWLMLSVLVVLYLIQFWPVIYNVFFDSSFHTQRVEWEQNIIEDAWAQFLEYWRYSRFSWEGCQSVFVDWVTATAAAGIVLYASFRDEQKRHIRYLTVLVVSAALTIAFLCLWNSAFITDLRKRLGGLLVVFNASRFTFLSPALFWAAFGIMVHLFLSIAMTGDRAETMSRKSRVFAAFLAAFVLWNTSCFLYDNSRAKENWRRYREGVVYTDQCFQTFYSQDLLQQVADYIGRPKEDYLVGSVGMNPMVAWYNGFHCIDFYSTNYALDYKYQFEKIIKKELEKSTTISDYFYKNGRKCYLYSAELGKKDYFTKNSTKKIKKLELNHDALREMGCEYIFSGVEIKKPELSGLTLLETFESDDSPYRLRLYQVDA